MEFVLLEEISDFESLKKGDKIIVRWSEYFLRHTKASKEIMSYEVFVNKKDDKEIICQYRYNHYFNYELYVEGKSNALEVYKVQSK